jgi:hypothetical protein
LNACPRAVFATLPVVDRSAVYLRSIRLMLVFLTVLTIVGIALTFVFGLPGIRAIDKSNTTTGFGQ